MPGVMSIGDSGRGFLSFGGEKIRPVMRFVSGYTSPDESILNRRKAPSIDPRGLRGDAESSGDEVIRQRDSRLTCLLA